MLLRPLPAVWPVLPYLFIGKLLLLSIKPSFIYHNYNRAVNLFKISKLANKNARYRQWIGGYQRGEGEMGKWVKYVMTMETRLGVVSSVCCVQVSDCNAVTLKPT